MRNVWIGIAAASILSLAGAGQAAAHNSSTCGVSGYLSATAKTPPTFGADGSCSSGHAMTLGSYLSLNGGGEINSYSNNVVCCVKSYSIRWTHWDTPCKSPLDFGEQHTWAVRAKLLVTNPDGTWSGHPTNGYDAYKSQTVTCPLL